MNVKDNILQLKDSENLFYSLNLFENFPVNLETSVFRQFRIPNKLIHATNILSNKPISL